MKFNPLMPELYVTDFNRSLRFYTETLGFALEYQRAHPGFAFVSYHGTQLMIQGLALDEVGGMKLEYPFGRGINLEIRTPDIALLVVSLGKHGYPLTGGTREVWRFVGDEQSEYGSLEILVSDPDGYLLRFAQDLGERRIAR